MSKVITGLRRYYPMSVKTGWFSSEILLVLQQEVVTTTQWGADSYGGSPQKTTSTDWENVNSVDELKLDTGVEVQYLMARIEKLENKINRG
jgi:hypothetical protein